MTTRGHFTARTGLFVLAVLWLCIVLPLSAMAAPYAALVMDARSGKVLHSENANTRLHPASLTKMMTLYIAFEAVEHGEISLDTMVKVSKKAAAEPPSKLGLRAGQRIKLRYLMRAAAVKSANDAATAIGEAIAGSEAAFARRMNRTAKAMGMTRTTFKNAHGLTESGHLSTAKDMSILGRHVIYDYPQYYNMWSRRTAYAGVKTVNHTNTRMLNSYKGADGIKTGYTRAAGFNLVASAERGRERVIATVFGGRSTATRNARVAQLLDLGFKRAPTRQALHRPKKPRYRGNSGIKAPTVVAGSTSGGKPAAGKIVRVKLAVNKSIRPRSRPAPQVDEQQLLAMKQEIQQALLETQAADAAAEEKAKKEAELAKAEAELAKAEAEQLAAQERALLEQTAKADAVKEEPQAQETAQETAQEPVVPVVTAAALPVPTIKPATRPKRLAAAPKPVAPSDPVVQERVQEVITRVSTSGGRHWGVNVGRYGSHYQAEKVLLKTALAEMSTLDGALRKVRKTSRGYDANFLGMTRETAELACQRLQARDVTCFMIDPS